MEEEFGPLDWYRAKTVEQMRSDLVTMAQGNYFDDKQQYAFMASGKLVIRTGAELNDQAPEGPGPEEYQTMDDEDIVEQYISRIKMFPSFVDIADQEGFAKAYLPALDNMNNVASRYMTGKGTRNDPMKSELQYGNGMELASEIQTGAITDYIASGFKSKEEFFEWYLSDVANNQAVLQPGQKQAEDFSIVDAGFYDETAPPNTRFPRKPETQAEEDLFKQEDKSFADRFNENFNRDVGPITQKIRNRPARDYYDLLAMMTRVGDTIANTPRETARLLGSAVRGPIEFGKNVVDNIQEGMDTTDKAPSLREIIDRLREVGTEGAFNPGDNDTE